jgi:hypothetical protein
MENFEPKKIILSKINEGRRYGYGGIQPEAINAPIEASAWAQIFAEALGDDPDISEVGNTGSPKVDMIDHYKNGILCKRLKFSNLKGEKGDSGIQAPVSGLYTLYVDSVTGYLYARTLDETFDKFRLDDSGNLYFIVGE